MADNEVIQIVGNAGGPPEEQKSEWINFSVAVTKSYDNDAPPRWVRIGTKKPHLVAWVKSNVKKGVVIAAEGYLNQSEYNGKPQYNLVAFRIGKVNFAPKEAQASESSDGGDSGFNWG